MAARDSRSPALASPLQPQIVGGTPTEYARWQGAVNLYDSGPGCTAVLIGPEAALTAAHCMVGFEARTSPLLVVGGADLREPGGPVPLAVVSEVATAPPIEGQSYWTHDIALLLLSREVSEAPYYALSTSSAKPKVISELTVVGYGATGLGMRDQGRHRDGTVRLMDAFSGQIQSRYTLFFQGPSMICHGDSGAPLFIRVGTDWKVVAIASATQTCSPDDLGYATYIPAHLEWIGETYRAWTGGELPTRSRGTLVPSAMPPRTLYLPSLCASIACDGRTGAAATSGSMQ
jgi:secreted trypsin-like serine protease